MRTRTGNKDRNPNLVVELLFKRTLIRELHAMPDRWFPTALQANCEHAVKNSLPGDACQALAGVFGDWRLGI